MGREIGTRYKYRPEAVLCKFILVLFVFVGAWPLSCEVGLLA